MIDSLKKLNRMLWVLGVASAIFPASSLAQLAPAYTVSTFAGNGTSGFSGDGSAATGAELASPYSVALDSAGNLYIADSVNNRIRKVTTAGVISTIAGNGTAAFKGDGAAATSAQLNGPTGVAVDGAGNVYIADQGNNVVRKIASGGTITTFAGLNSKGAGFSGDAGAATSATLNAPSAVAVDKAGNVFISDTGNSVIRRVATSGTITTYGGFSTAVAGFQGDGGPASGAEFSSPLGLTFDKTGNLYIADRDNNRVRKIAIDGTITTVAGSSTPTPVTGYSGDGKLATAALLSNPSDVAVDQSGDIFIADRFNGVIRMVTPDGIIHTVAGNGVFAFGGDGGPATSASFSFPTGVAADGSGNVYVADNQVNRIRLLTVSAQVPVISANGVVSASGYGGASSIAPGGFIEIYGSNLGGAARGWAASDFTAGNAPTSLGGTTVTIGGLPAFVSYVSGGQVNALVPSGVGTGAQPVTVMTALGTTAAYTVNVNATQPGLLAPAAFAVGSKQYAVALFSDNVTYVAPTGAIAGIASRPAHPGDTILFYGAGFGAVTPNTPAGVLASGQTKLTGSLQVTFGSVPAVVSYSGLAPTFTGLYQFNVVVPNVASSDLVPLTFTLNGANLAQTLYISVR